MSAVSACPICKRTIGADAVAPRPFCSPRCRAIDLGSWLEGSYRIASPIADSDDEALPVEGADDAGANRR